MPRNLNGLWGEWPSNRSGCKRQNIWQFPDDRPLPPDDSNVHVPRSFGQPCGGECRFPCFSSPVADNIPQCPNCEKQEYEQ